MRNKFYTDAQLYVDGETFLKECTNVVMNLRIDYKYTFGYNLLNNLRDAIIKFSLSYKIDDNIKKLELTSKCCELFEMIEIQLNIMKDVNVISEKQFINLYHHLGLLTTQLNGWYNSLCNRK